MKKFINNTEEESRYNFLESKNAFEIVSEMNNEDKGVPIAVSKVLGVVSDFVEIVVKQMTEGGKLFYIGAGTSGRLGVLDASECPPTFGVPTDMVIGLIAGGDYALRNAVEFSEDDTKQGWKDLIEAGITKKDALVGIAASGRTPYVIGAMQRARDLGLTTASISCNENAPISQLADYPIEIITGPEYLTGSTRLKAGTGQKLVLNMISTAIMIRMGRVKGNRMVDMQLSNKKLVDRGVDILVEELSIDRKDAERLLLKYKSVREAISGFKTV